MLDRLPEWSPPADGGHVVVVSPHPDDETLGVGGLLAELLAATMVGLCRRGDRR